MVIELKSIIPIAYTIIILINYILKLKKNANVCSKFRKRLCNKHVIDRSLFALPIPLIVALITLLEALLHLIL